jgi:transposase
MAITLPDARHLSDDVLEALRLRALRGCELGFTESEMAELLGVCRETVSRWWSAYRSAGLDGLPQERSGRPLGSGRTLDDQQAAHLQQLIDENNPEDLGIAAPLWTRPAVRDLIRKEYGITMPVRTVGEYLKRWGYTAKRPRRHSKDQEPEEVREWLEETYPEIEEQASKEDAEILWCDETGVAADEQPRLGYARKGCPATIEVPDSHIRANVVSAISNTGDLHFMTYTGNMNAAVFITFLELLLSEMTKKVILIVDHLRVHDSWAVSDWVLERLDRIEMHLMPTYAPELNPDEYLNNDLKGNVHATGLSHNQAEIVSRIKDFLDRLHLVPEHITSYFQHPCVQYAAGC